MRRVEYTNFEGEKEVYMTTTTRASELATHLHMRARINATLKDGDPIDYELIRKWAPILEETAALLDEHMDYFIQVERDRTQKACIHVWGKPEGKESDCCFAVCVKCKYHSLEWYCPDSPTHLCSYSADFDSCDYCGQPEERK